MSKFLLVFNVVIALIVLVIFGSIKQDAFSIAIEIICCITGTINGIAYLHYTSDVVE